MHRSQNPAVKRYIPMSEDEIWAFLARGKVMALATIGREGYPHNTPVWYVVRNKRLYFRAGPSKIKIKNIGENPKISVTVERGLEYTEQRGVMIQGLARRARDVKLRKLVNGLLLSKYAKWRNYREMPLEWRRRFENEEREIIEILPKRIASWDNRKLTARKEKVPGSG